MKFISKVMVVSWLGLMLGGCTSPEIPNFDEENNTTTTNNTVSDAGADTATIEDMGEDVAVFVRPEMCDALDECGPGWLCDIENARCVEGYSEVNGVYSDRIVLGFVGDTSGSTGAVGRSIVAGINAYFSHTNATRGGVNGRLLELKVYNDGGDPNVGATMVTQALENREVFAFIGNQGDGLAELTVNKFNDANVVLFAPVTGGSAVRKSPADRYIFNYRVSYAEENARMVDYFVNESNPPFPAPNFALFTEAEADGKLGALGQSALDGMARTLGVDPHRIAPDAIHRATYKRDTNTVDAAVESMIRWLASGERYEVEFMGYPGQIFAFVVVTAHDQQAATFLKKFKDDMTRLRSGLPLTYTLTQEEIMRVMSSHLLFGVTSSAGDGLSTDLIQSGADKYCLSEFPNQSDMVLSQVVPFYGSNSTTVIRYRDQLAAYDAGLKPGFNSLEGYIAARLAVEALQRAGGALTDEHFVNTIEGISNYTELALAPTPIDMLDHQAMSEVYGTLLDEDCSIRQHEGSN